MKSIPAGDGTSFEEAAQACLEDVECGGVACQKKKGADQCFVASGSEYAKQKAWYSFINEC